MPALDSSLPSVRVIVRGWLNCNQVLLSDDAGHVVVDTGYSGCRDETLRLLALPQNLGEQPLARVINTHCHADHMGGNAALVARYGCAVSIPAGDADDVRAWNSDAFLMDYARHHIDRFEFTDTLAIGDEFNGGGMRWQALPAPGHDMNAFVFWCAEHRILITGDALWENGVGAMFPFPSLDTAVAAAHVTLDRIEKLAPRWVIPGHGKPFTDAAAAVARARRRLDGFVQDPRKNALHVLKSLFSFALLAAQTMRLQDVPGFIESVPAYGDLNARFIGLPMAELADHLTGELIRARVARVTGGSIQPTLQA